MKIEVLENERKRNLYLLVEHKECIGPKYL